MENRRKVEPKAQIHEAEECVQVSLMQNLRLVLPQILINYFLILQGVGGGVKPLLWELFLFQPYYIKLNRWRTSWFQHNVQNNRTMIRWWSRQSTLCSFQIYYRWIGGSKKIVNSSQHKISMFNRPWKEFLPSWDQLHHDILWNQEKLQNIFSQGTDEFKFPPLPPHLHSLQPQHGHTQKAHRKYHFLATWFNPFQSK